MRAREGDVIETVDRCFFDVKGLVHPPKKVIAFVRFVPDPAGDRNRGGLTYRKVYHIPERMRVAREKFPRYMVHDPVFNELLCEVPVMDVKQHYKPMERLRELRKRDGLDDVESQALQFVELAKETANVPWSKLGVSGSILIKLHKPASDIDLIVYGTENCRRVHSALGHLLEEGDLIRRYDMEGLKSLFDFRSKDTAMSFEDFVRTESRKSLQGKFMGRDYFVRFVKDWKEIEERYGTVRYEPLGNMRVKAKVLDDSEAIFTPCHYKIDDVEVLEGVKVEPIEEIASFRGRFCEQARNGETVIAQGKVERVYKEGEREHYRVLLGNKTSDHMIIVRN